MKQRACENKAIYSTISKKAIFRSISGSFNICNTETVDVEFNKSVTWTNQWHWYLLENNINNIHFFRYCKNPKISDTWGSSCNHPKILTKCLYNGVMHPKDADGIANSVDPDQTAPLGAVWSGSTLFAQTCLSENLGSLRYNPFPNTCTFFFQILKVCY